MSEVICGAERDCCTGQSRAGLGRLPFEECTVTPALYRAVITPGVGTPIIPALQYAEDKPVEELV